jgi:RNA polymerase sigma-70 factor (ECF subfamily)
MSNDMADLTMSEVTPRATTDDRELYIRFRDHHDRAAFDELVHRYEGELYGYLRRYVRDADLAQDIFQGTFIRLFEKAGSFDERRAFRPWLYSIATHLAVDTLRKLRRSAAASFDHPETAAEGDDEGAAIERLPAPTPTPFEGAVATERREWTRQAVDRLPEHLRVAVILVFFQGLKYSEAADVLGLPLGTLKSRIHAAIRKLDEAWHEQRGVHLSSTRRTGAGRRKMSGRDDKSRTDLPAHEVISVQALRSLSIPGETERVDAPAGLARSTCLSVREQFSGARPGEDTDQLLLPSE